MGWTVLVVLVAYQSFTHSQTFPNTSNKSKSLARFCATSRAWPPLFLWCHAILNIARTGLRASYLGPHTPTPLPLAVALPPMYSTRVASSQLTFTIGMFSFVQPLLKLRSIRQLPPRGRRKAFERAHRNLRLPDPETLADCHVVGWILILVALRCLQASSPS